MKRSTLLIIALLLIIGLGLAFFVYRPSPVTVVVPAIGNGTGTSNGTVTPPVAVTCDSVTTDLQAALRDPSRVCNLDLHNQKLTTTLPSQIQQMKNLRVLDVSGNAMTGLPAELGQLTKLEILNVSNNRLTGLPMELGNLTRLRVFDISGNPYSEQDLAQIAAKLPNTDIRK